MTPSRLLGLVTLTLFLLPMHTPGQTIPDARAAEAVLRQAFDAHAAMQWDAVAALMHPDALRRFHLAQIDHQRSREQVRSRAGGERYPPEMPAEVRTWFDERQRKHEEKQLSGVAAEFAGISSLAELEALSPEAAFARWLEAHDARTLLMRQQKAMGRAIPPELPLAAMHPTNRIVGSVVENDSTVQVLYRSEHADEEARVELDRPSVATVRRSGGGWRIWSTQDDPPLFGMENWVIGIDLPEDRAERLREIAKGAFSWPEGETPRFRVSVQGYAGDGYAPEAIRLEMLRADGSRDGLDLPYEALMPLWEYLQNWVFLPVREERVQPRD